MIVIDARSRFRCSHEYVATCRVASVWFVCHRCGLTRELLPISTRTDAAVVRFPGVLTRGDGASVSAGGFTGPWAS